MTVPVAAQRSSQSISSLKQLLELNDKRLSEFAASPFCALAANDMLRNPVARDVFLACMQRFSRECQSLFFARQLTCEDERYRVSFLRHLQEEFGHDLILAQRVGAYEIDDPRFEALACWFTLQMLILDNADKAALVFLVLEHSADHFLSRVSRLMGNADYTGFFAKHEEVDSTHAALGPPLLEGLDSITYARLGRTVTRGWDMLDAMTVRILELVEQSATTMPPEAKQEG